GLTYIYITHDLASARFFCDRVAIMYLGKIVEIGPVQEIFDSPRHPYTKAFAPCGWESRDLRMVLEQRWTDVDADQYASESALVGPATNFDVAESPPGVALLRPGRGAGEDEVELLNQVR